MLKTLKTILNFNQNALPAQAGENIQVISATLNQDFKLGILHLDNEVTWQKTSNEKDSASAAIVIVPTTCTSKQS